MQTISLDLTPYNSYKLHSTAKAAIIPYTTDELIRHLPFKQEGNFVILGGGTNVILKNSYYTDGIFIVLSRFNKYIHIKNNSIFSGAGTTLACIVEYSLRNSLTGMEKLIGIPGTLGGAIRMNAGAYGTEIGSLVAQLEILNVRTGNLEIRNRNDINFSYRSSSIDDDEIVTWARIDLEPSQDRSISRDLANQIMRLRRAKLPYDVPNAGSVFKRPMNQFSVGSMVESLGLLGYRIGDAMISPLHGGVFINTGFARANEILALADHVKRMVKANYGVDLEMEQIPI